MSEHRAEVFRVEQGMLGRHPNADALALLKWQGWQTCVKLGEFAPGDLAVFVEPDTLVPTNRPEFSFLAAKANREGKLKAVGAGFLEKYR